MADLLGSILGSMEKPPVLDPEQRKRVKGHINVMFPALLS